MSEEVKYLIAFIVFYIIPLFIDVIMLSAYKIQGAEPCINQKTSWFSVFCPIANIMLLVILLMVVYCDFNDKNN